MGVPYAEVIGDPIGHSKSPLIHEFWLRQMNIVGEYKAAHVRPGELADYFASRRTDPDWRGCNVTMPHKEAVAGHIDDLDPMTRRIGAVNTVVNHSTGLLVGTNTDFQGVHCALSDSPAAGRNVVLLGAGGAARAVLEELRQSKPASVTILNRSEEKARTLLCDFGLDGETGPIGGAPAADLLINATSLGMAGQPPLDIDLSGLLPGAAVFDMVYHPLVTPLLAEARRRGFHAVDGLTMLIWQASMAFTYFFGDPPPNPDSSELRKRLTR